MNRDFDVSGTVGRLRAEKAEARQRARAESRRPHPGSRAALTLLAGGGEPQPQQECGICGVPHPGGSCTVLRRHLDDMRLRGRTERTIYCRERSIIRLGGELPVPVLEADAATLAAWRAGLDISPGAVRDRISNVTGFYSWAAEEGLRPGNPAARLARPRAGQRLPRPISEKDLMLVLETAPPRIRPWIVLAAWAGLRCQEIAYLTREAILDTAVPPVLVVTLEMAKGHRRERVVPLSPFVIAELRAAQLPTRGFAFRREDGRPGANQPWRISSLTGRHFRRMGVSATLHSLRHRFGSQCYQGGGRDLRAVQSLLGHTSPETTALYAAFSDSACVDAVASLPVPPDADDEQP